MMPMIRYDLSVSEFKSFMLAGGGAPIHVEVPDTRHGRPDLDVGDEGFDKGPGTLDEDFDGATGLVADVPDEANGGGLPLDEIAEPDALHKAVDDHVCGGFHHRFRSTQANARVRASSAVFTEWIAGSMFQVRSPTMGIPKSRAKASSDNVP